MENQPAKAHISSGWRKILEHPYIYNLQQLILGSETAKKTLINKYCKPPNRSRILEVGCGTGSLLRCIDKDLNVEYCGYDLNPTYIHFAQKPYGDRGRFIAQTPSKQTCRRITSIWFWPLEFFIT